jgi:hypothetical protein
LPGPRCTKGCPERRPWSRWGVAAAMRPRVRQAPAPARSTGCARRCVPCAPAPLLRSVRGWWRCVAPRRTSPTALCGRTSPCTCPSGAQPAVGASRWHRTLNALRQMCVADAALRLGVRWGKRPAALEDHRASWWAPHNPASKNQQHEYRSGAHVVLHILVCVMSGGMCMCPLGVGVVLALARSARVNTCTYPAPAPVVGAGHIRTSVAISVPSCRSDLRPGTVFLPFCVLSPGSP